MRILSATDNSQCSATAYGGYSASAGSTRTPRASAEPPSPSSTFASTALYVSAAASSRVYCYAVAFLAAQVQENVRLLRPAPATAHENFREAHVLLPTSTHAAITRLQGVKNHLTKRIRKRTVVARALERFPRIACTAQPCALNCARPSRNDLFTSCARPLRYDLLPNSKCDLTLTVLPEWHHLHCNAIAQDCGFSTRSRSDLRSSRPANFEQLYIKCSPQHSPFISFTFAQFNLFLVARRFFAFAMNADEKEKLFNGVVIRKNQVDDTTIKRLRECAVFDVC